MIPIQRETFVQTNNLGETRRATITANARLFDMFASQIYSDIYTAILREISCNARDANIVAGRGDVAIEIKLPTSFTPFLAIRDFGNSMSKDFLMNDFMSYTTSTKTHDNTTTGAFGVGSKSPLSYTDQFAIKTFQQGTLRIYSVFKDADGCPSIAFLSEQATDEPDGTEISMPIDAKDIDSFRDARHCLRHFDPLPVLYNIDQQLFAPEYTVKNDTWGFRKDSTISQVIQAGVAYPIDPLSLPADVRDTLAFNIDFFVPTGSCNIALSREALSYDDTTINYLSDAIKAIQGDLVKHISEIFESQPTLWEAKALYEQQLRQTGGAKHKMLQQHASYKGENLTSSFNPMPALVDKITMAQITTKKYDRANYGYWTEGTTSPTTRAWLVPIHPKDVSIILLDDGPQKPVLRMRNYLENNDIATKGVVIMRPNALSTIDKAEWLALIEYLGNPPYKWLSEIEPMVVVRTPGSTAAKRLEAVRAYYTNSFGNEVYRNSKFEPICPAGGYYMLMDNFKVLDGQATVKQLIASGLNPKEVYWFNKNDAHVVKNNPAWKPAIAKYRETVSEYRKTHKNLALASAMQKFLNKGGFYYNFRRLLEADVKFRKTGSLAQFVKTFKLVESQLNHSDNTMRELLEIKYDKQTQMIKTMFEKFEKDYPELYSLIHTTGFKSELISVYNRLV